MENKKVYQELAGALQARNNCLQSSNETWFNHWSDKIEYIQNSLLPHGSGIDGDNTISLDENAKRIDKIVIYTGYHHMNENGFYTHWTNHTITVYPDFTSGIRLSISGRNDNDIKDYLYDVFYDALTDDYKE